MRRRDKAGGKAAKTQRPRTLKRGGAPKVVGRRSSPVSNMNTDVARLTHERDEALERQTATAEILGAISGSPTDTQPVFDAIVQSGLKLFPGAATTIVLPDGDQMQAVAIADKDLKREKAWRRRFPSVLDRTQMHGTAILDCKVIDFPDVTEHVTGPMAPGARNFLASGYRAITIMPMIRGKTAIGAISVVRVAPGPLSEKQRELLKTFAAQAVIAIENTRLLNELRESLQQQTATADVLTVISSSPGTLDPVFSTMLVKATELCEASYSTLWLHEGDGFRTAAIHGDLPPAWIEQWRSGALYRPGRDVGLARAAEGRQPIQIADMRTDPSYLRGDPLPVSAVEIAGIRTLLVVPMFKESEPVGAIAIYRKEVRPFTDKQIELVNNFAAQAVIAIENTRLLNELRERTDDLSNSATADRHGRRAQGYQPLDVRFADGAKHAGRSRPPDCAKRIAALCVRAQGTSIPLPQPTVSPSNSAIVLRTIPLSRIVALFSAVQFLRAVRSMWRTSSPIPSMINPVCEILSVCAPGSPYR